MNSILLNPKQEAYAQEVVRNGGDKVAAFKASGWAWENMAPNTLSKEADNKFNHPKIAPRIAELKLVANAIADKEFSITVEQRLRWLKEIVEAGLATYSDMHGNARRESLGAADKAINTMNSMLSPLTPPDDNPPPLAINFTVEDASKA
jgi:hypothetical protein